MYVCICVFICVYIYICIRLQCLQDADVFFGHEESDSNGVSVDSAQRFARSTATPAAPSRVSDYQMGQKVEAEIGSGRPTWLPGKSSARSFPLSTCDMHLWPIQVCWLFHGYLNMWGGSFLRQSWCAWRSWSWSSSSSSSSSSAAAAAAASDLHHHHHHQHQICISISIRIINHQLSIITHHSSSILLSEIILSKFISSMAQIWLEDLDGSGNEKHRPQVYSKSAGRWLPAEIIQAVV